MARAALRVGPWMVIAILSLPAGLRAGPTDRFQADYLDCASKYLAASGGAFSCSICGVAAGCSGDNCTWGGLTTNLNNQEQFSAVVQAGFRLYCLNSGGSLVASAAAVAVLARDVGTAIQSRGPRPLSSAIGGTLELTAVDQADSSYGVAVPVYYQASPQVGISGTVLAGKAPGLTQVGFNARPSLALLERAEPGQPRLVVAAGLPVQLLVSTGDQLATSLGYLVGGSLLGAVVSEDGQLGGGATLDLHYVNGVQAPLVISGRYRFTLGGYDFAVQPAVGLDLTAPLDSISITLLVGLELGDFIVGLQLFAHGSSNYSAALGVNRVSRPVAAATGLRRAAPPPAVPSPSLLPPPGPFPVGALPPPAPSPLVLEPAAPGGAVRCVREKECSGADFCYRGYCVQSDPPLACRVEKDCPGDDTCAEGMCVRYREAAPRR